MTDNPGFSRRAWRSMIIVVAILAPLEIAAGILFWKFVMEVING